MAALTAFANYRNKKVTGVGALALSGAEDAITVFTNAAVQGASGTTTQTRFNGNMPSNRTTVQMVCANPWLYHSLTGQAATDGYPVAANQILTLTFQDGDVFYVVGTAAAILHMLVLGG